MATAMVAVDDGSIVARVVIQWKRPYHLSSEEARDWACEQVARLVQSDAVDHAELTHVRGASAGHPSDCDWMLELHVSSRDVDGLVDEPSSAEWLDDLRRLRLEPRVIIADGGIRLSPERD
jgi:hypothetical protein